MLHRFYCPSLVEAGSVRLSDSEAHHLIHVLRRHEGDAVELFNGAGLVTSCRITSIGKRDVELEVLNSRKDLPPETVLTIATAVPKGDRFDWLIEKATELGVTRIIPLTTTRSVVDPRESKLEKLRQTVISACKQSGRNHSMEISPVTAWRDLLKECQLDQRLLVADPGGAAFHSVPDHSVKEHRHVVIAIGPEGGFSNEEIQAASSQGATLIRLGRYLLRVETAAIAFAARYLQ